MIPFILGSLSIASGVGVVLSVALHVVFWSGGLSLHFARPVLAAGLVPVMLSTTVLLFVRSAVDGSRWTFEQLLRGAPSWVMPALYGSWAYAVWVSVAAVNGLFGIDDRTGSLFASSAFFGIYATLFAVNFTALQRRIGRWPDAGSSGSASAPPNGGW